jgi:type I pantothenate kinase
MIDAVTVLATRIAPMPEAKGAPVLVGVAGAVAAGKTSLALALADALTVHEVDADVVSTDGFIFPNAVLSARGLQTHKGYPESYDVERLRAFAVAVGSGQAAVEVPVYSHLTYDIVEGASHMVRPEDVIIVEGVNTLGALDGLLDLGIYVDAAEADLERWYVTRFRELVAEARADPTSFYRPFVDRTPEEVDALATMTWRTINLVNLRDHIAPTRASADVVVVKGPDHAVLELRERREA